MFRNFLFLGLFLTGCFMLIQGTTCIADSGPVSLQKASGQTLTAGIGHFARARSLLMAAVREFDLGLAKVNPDALLDSAKWRETLIERAQEMERVLDPQPRASKGGVRYEPDNRLLTEANQK